MLHFLSDEDFNNRIVRGLRRRLPTLDLARVQDVGLMKQPDTEVLAWAAQEGRMISPR
jgi:predicted nuclease of predicted toxin-antitoxin system